MSFVNRDGVMNLIENLLMYSWPEESIKGSIKVPFKLTTYEDAMETYGTDKPDLRIPYQVRALTCIIFYFLLCEINVILFQCKIVFQIQDLTHMFDLPVLKEAVKHEDNQQKVYALVLPKKSVGISFTSNCILLLR